MVHATNIHGHACATASARLALAGLMALGAARGCSGVPIVPARHEGGPSEFGYHMVETVSRGVRPVVEEVDTTGVAGHSTYRLSLRLGAGRRNVYAIYGSKDYPMIVPPAYQYQSGVGVDIGGVNPELVALVGQEASFDSWLTVGIDDGKVESRLGHIGMDFDSWSATSGMNVTDGSVFWMDPPKAPASNDTLVAQLTMPSGSAYVATLSAQGYETNGQETWDEQGLRFSIGAQPAQPAPTSLPCSTFQERLISICVNDCSTASCPGSTETALNGCTINGTAQHLGDTFCRQPELPGEFTPTPSAGLGPDPTAASSSTECSVDQALAISDCEEDCETCPVSDTNDVLKSCTLGGLVQEFGRTFCIEQPLVPIAPAVPSPAPTDPSTPVAPAAPSPASPTGLFHPPASPAHSGLTCEDEVCNNGGTCVDGRCVCPPSFGGDRCDAHDPFDNCAAEPCANGGVCNDLFGEYTCLCQGPWQGERCTVPKLVLPVVCENGGTRVGDDLSSARCSCAPGYSGERCEDSSQHDAEVAKHAAVIVVGEPGDRSRKSSLSSWGTSFVIAALSVAIGMAIAIWCRNRRTLRDLKGQLITSESSIYGVNFSHTVLEDTAVATKCSTGASLHDQL
jgi:hypothetical protein